MIIDKIILASASPRRRELIQMLNIPVEIVPADIDEKVDSMLSPEEAARSLAEQKAEFVALNCCEKAAGSVILGADTTVVLTGAKDGTAEVGVETLCKPKDESDAERMLNALSGRTHKVITGVSAYAPGGKHLFSFAEVTKVEFYELSETDIKNYLQSGEWTDKAGAYAVQGLGALLVKKIDGCYNNVVGLPVSRLKRELENV